IDVTYARMKEKSVIDLDRGRISQEAYDILKGDAAKMPVALSNARAMKLFRTIVETLGGSMSTQTFGKDAPLAKPQKHVPRLIVGLDWETAFTVISAWVARDDFETQFLPKHWLVDRLAGSIERQLRGLHALALQNVGNSNTEYLAELMEKMDFKIADNQLTDAYDTSLENIERLLSRGDAPKRATYGRRMYDAARAQVEHDIRRGGGHVRGDMPAGSATREETLSRLEPPAAHRPAPPIATPPPPEGGGRPLREPRTGVLPTTRSEEEITEEQFKEQLRLRIRELRIDRVRRAIAQALGEDIDS
ncbi:MAG: hypothetical protein WA021_02605, partial [Minisyncoccia bacterium]